MFVYLLGRSKSGHYDFKLSEFILIFQEVSFFMYFMFSEKLHFDIKISITIRHTCCISDFYCVFKESNHRLLNITPDETHLLI